MPSLSEQLQEVRSRAEVCLYSGGRVAEVRVGVMAISNLPLPPCSKYCHIAAETMIIENSFGSNRKETLASLQRLSTALNILEKYGCNLTNPNRPKYWRTVKHNNPVFRATVDAIQGGRAVLCLYGYSNQQPDGLSFPDDVTDPDVGRVAAVTLEVMSLRMELEMLTKEAHPHPEFYERIIPTLRHKDVGLNTDAVVCHFPSSCHTDSQTKSLALPLHHHSSRGGNQGQSLSTTHQSLRNIQVCSTSSNKHPENCTICGIFRISAHCVTCLLGLCSECDRLYHSYPERANHRRTASLPRYLHHHHKTKTVTVNSVHNVLCEECERPRLELISSKADESQPATVTGLFLLLLRPPSPVRRVPALPIKPKGPAPEDLDSWRQRLMKEEGLKLIQLIRDGEKKGVSPEEVFTSMRVAGDSSILPCRWLKTELPLLLDNITTLVATSPLSLSRAEAKQAWLTAGGDTERAARQALRDRLSKVTHEGSLEMHHHISSVLCLEMASFSSSPHPQVKELSALGFSDEAPCHEALRQSGGEVRGALALLQRPLLEPFHKHIWSDKPEPPVDIHHPDKQRICRRLLAVYNLPSWGRCELALSLLLEHSATYSLEDVVQAVRESHDREFIRRMQSLTSCQCSVCCGCFQQHFTIAVRDKHIRDMVCPVCWEPDINDPEHLNSYFSTLDIQLRECLEPEVYELFHKKLTEQALIKDPKFLWCCHCSYGFIYDGDQLKVTCFQCRNSFCAQCKKPWESQHAGLSCEQYQSWKRENDPEYQRQGLAGYLRDNGITCPNCRFQYALSKGGCMHFCCSQCRYQFCSGCNNPFHTTCAVDECSVSGLHAHHPRDCLFYLRDWEPSRLQTLLQNNGVAFNTEPPLEHRQVGLCGVVEQKDEGGSSQTRTVQLRLSLDMLDSASMTSLFTISSKHYREYLVSLINSHSIDPAPLYSSNELLLACRRYKVEDLRREGEDSFTYFSRLLQKLMDEEPLGDKVPRKK
ncbi:hypothetical protein F7725_012148 [Dissostichus mawsoni]|uniref:RING-type domain-containing protein n=1 Tax=Dissostichus mawsoni TaxID=36200 RepID=A0A7J5ZDY4_DISMA|nr:hypothetical protein F7725_012148 [Dissostichus mawsoni]